MVLDDQRMKVSEIAETIGSSNERVRYSYFIFFLSKFCKIMLICTYYMLLTTDDLQTGVLYRNIKCLFIHPTSDL
jgi:hypothetical protein